MPFVKLNKRSKTPHEASVKVSWYHSSVGILFFIATYVFLGNMYLFYCLLAGLAASVAIDYVTDYYTGRDRKPVVNR